MNRIRIISDGTYTGTRVVNAETGEPITNIVSIELKIDANKPANTTAVIEFTAVEIDIVGIKKIKKPARVK